MLEFDFITREAAELACEPLRVASVGRYVALLASVPDDVKADGSEGRVRLTPIAASGNSATLRTSALSAPSSPNDVDISADSDGMATALSGGMAATSVAFHPFVPRYFASGFSDGSVALYDFHLSDPLLVWDDVASSPVTHLLWSSSRPAVLFVMHDGGRLSVFDFTEAMERPVQSVDLSRRVTSFALSDSSGSGSGSKGVGSSSSETQFVAYCTEDGSTEVHELRPEYCRLRDGEDQFLEFRFSALR